MTTAPKALAKQRDQRGARIEMTVIYLLAVAATRNAGTIMTRLKKIRKD
jgi:hypothetical protein